MKCLLIAYLNEGLNIETLEGVMNYHGFGAIEQNKNFRVFSGHCKGSIFDFADKLNHELEEMIFHIEDSIFITYPQKAGKGYPSLSNLIIKRKGNKHLRKNHITK
jgi:hypothetical protein